MIAIVIMITITIVIMILLIRGKRITMTSYRSNASDICQHETLNQWNLTITTVNMNRYNRGNVRDHHSLQLIHHCYCPACRTSLIATRFWVVVICPIIKCLTVLEFSFILFDLCLFITIFNFILNYVPIVTFWIINYHKIWVLLIIFCFIWNYWIIYFFTCLEVFWSAVS